MENVLGLKDMRWQADFVDLFESFGYAVAFHVLRAADYGVSQLRRRVIFAGHRERGYFVGLAQTCGRSAWSTVWDAIGDLPPLGPGESKSTYERELNATPWPIEDVAVVETVVSG